MAHASPRSQTIDGSSPGAAGGLLGAVKKDSVTADYLAEAGPLAAANHGVCCIQHLEKLTVHHAVSSISLRLKDKYILVVVADYSFKPS